jgi:surface antigen
MKKLIKISIVASLFLSMYACSSGQQKKMFVEVIEGDVNLVIQKNSGDVTLTHSDTLIVVDNEKIKYEYTTSDKVLIRFWDESIGYIVEESYSDIDKHKGKFRI